MRPGSLALGGVLALLLAGAAAAGPLNPQPLPPGEPGLTAQPSPGRQAQAAYLLTPCASGKPAPRARKPREQGHAAASHGSGGGAGKVQTTCASGKP